MLDVWRFVRAHEPAGFLAARSGGHVVGYAIFVRSLRTIQRRAVWSGAALRWALSYATGRYRFRLRGAVRALANKALFVRGAQAHRTSGDAQLLNIAVAPPCAAAGIGRSLVREGLRYLAGAGVREARLEVRPWNGAAVRLYESTGWRCVARTRDRGGEWLVMTVEPQV